MDLTQLANLGEFLGGVAVLLTLVYLALQVRQNTKAVASSTLDSVASAAANVGFQIASSDALVEAVELALVEPDSLTPRQSLRLGMFFRSVFRNYENYVHQYQQGFLDEDLWEGYRQNLRDILGSPYMRQWWSDSSHVFGTKFRAFVNEEVEKAKSSKTAFDPSFARSTREEA